MSNVKRGQKRRSKKKNMYTELDFEKLIDRMNEHQVTIDDEIITLNNIDQILDVRANCIYETKTITSGPIREMEMYPLFPKKDVPEEFRVKGTTKSRKNLNNKNAVKCFTRKANANFGKGDYYATLNYYDKNRPKTHEEAVWKYFNEELGIHTIEEVVEFDKKLVLDIGILGCSKEEIERLMKGR